MDSKQIVHAEPVLGSLNLARVGRADRVDGIGPDDAGLEKTHLIPEFQAAGMVESRIQAQIRKRGRGKISLVAQIVDGQQACAVP